MNYMLQVRAGMNRQSGVYEIITDNTYKPHEQVFISYGPHDNTTLFLYYGFTLAYNVHNNVCFSVGEKNFVSSVSSSFSFSVCLYQGFQGPFWSFKSLEIDFSIKRHVKSFDSDHGSGGPFHCCQFL